MGMLPEIEIDIDQDVIIPCPLVDFKIRRAANFCPECEHFKGVFQMGTGGDWHQKYGVRCAGIIERRTHSIDVIEK